MLEIQIAINDFGIINKYSILVIPGKYGGITKEARAKDMFAQQKNHVDAIALVLPAIHQKLFARIYYKLIKKPYYKYKFCKTEHEAIEWLLSSKHKK